MSLAFTMLETYKAAKLSREKTAVLQQMRLNMLVSYARANSPYYRHLYKDIGERFTLADLPVTDKPGLMSEFDNVLTDRNITMRRIDEFTAVPDNVGRMIDGKYLIFKTSGSTGNPAVVLYDKRCIDVSSAVAAFRTFARKQDLKAFMKNGKRTAGVFADHGFYLACGMSRYLSLKMPHKKSKITVDVNLPESEIVKALNDFRPAMLSGYPSNLALLADAKGLDIHPDVIITGGELLTDDIKQKLAGKFSCYVQTHYSCTEGGEIACECSEGHLHINSDWVIVEPVDSEGRPEGFGVQSDKVLITNLANYIQPFIRYELTDRITVHDEVCRCGKSSYWLEIEGRTDDILSFDNGVRIAPMSLYKILEEIKEIRRFQLVYKDAHSLELRIISDEREKAFEKAKHDLLSFFSEKGINDTDIALSELGPQADKVSGKFKHILRA
ncbi:MAG: phenylacetate--CoA ligase family protein [Oscillospiraceae bacterium]|nr:phenylacetate--CoA ligase family protein [Oscillospiraceae bacterium]